MKIVMSLFLFLFASALFAAMPQSVWCEEENVATEETVQATDRRIPNKIMEDTTPLREESYSLEYMGQRVTSSLRVDELLKQPIGDNVYRVGEILADLGTALQALREQMKTRPDGVINPIAVVDTRNAFQKLIADFEKDYGTIADLVSDQSPKCVLTRDTLVKTQDDLQTAEGKLAGLYEDLYGGVKTVAILIRTNPVEQTTEVVYPDGSPVKFQLAKIPTKQGLRVVSLQRDPDAPADSQYSVMVCENIFKYPPRPDGFREITLSISKGGSIDDAVAMLQGPYGLDSRLTPGLLRSGAQRVAAAY